MEKIAIFYHVYQYGDWENIHTNQIIKLQHSGLYDAAQYVHIAGLNKEIRLPFYLHKANYECNDNVTSEFNTLKSLYNFSVENPEYKCLFIHSKGVTWSNPAFEEIPVRHSNFPVSNHKKIYDYASRWRHYMEHFVIKKWQKCLSLLNEYDCVGTEWETKAYFKAQTMEISFYSGNFWWANANYIRTLELNFIENSDFYLHGLDNRHSCEVWIGTKNPKAFNFYNSNKNLYMERIEDEEYVNITGD